MKFETKKARYEWMILQLGEAYNLKQLTNHFYNKNKVNKSSSSSSSKKTKGKKRNVPSVMKTYASKKKGVEASNLGESFKANGNLYKMNGNEQAKVSSSSTSTIKVAIRVEKNVKLVFKYMQ